MKSKRSKSRTDQTPNNREFCVIHPDGRISDSELHEAILAGDHPIANEIGKEQARRAGLSEQEIKKFFG
jgi:hypothetical protein